MHGRDIAIYVLDHGSQGSIADIVTSLWAGQFGVQILAGASDFSLQNFKTRSRAHPASWSVGIEGCCHGNRVARV
jgi:hypothetical protein